MLQAPDLKELLRSKGKTQAEVGLHHAYVSQIATGVRRAGAEAITRMAAALGCTTETVCAACDESFRRAQVGDLAAVPAPSAPSAAPSEA
jgi:transcriptional regulator with XRE-family HTH domain